MSPFYDLMATSEEIVTNRIGKSIFIALIQNHIDSVPDDTSIQILQKICQELLNSASKRDTLQEQRNIIYKIRKKVYKKLFIIQHPDFRPIQKMKIYTDDEDEIEEGDDHDDNDEEFGDADEIAEEDEFDDEE
jgi:hypothetical protein